MALSCVSPHRNGGIATTDVNSYLAFQQLGICFSSQRDTVVEFNEVIVFKTVLAN